MMAGFASAMVMGLGWLPAGLGALELSQVMAFGALGHEGADHTLHVVGQVVPVLGAAQVDKSSVCG